MGLKIELSETSGGDICTTIKTPNSVRGVFWYDGIPLSYDTVQINEDGLIIIDYCHVEYTRIEKGCVIFKEGIDLELIKN
jgi:hypothetical protein